MTKNTGNWINTLAPQDIDKLSPEDIDTLSPQEIKELRNKCLVRIVDLGAEIAMEKHKESPCRESITMLTTKREKARRLRNALVIKSGQKQWEPVFSEYYV